MPAINDAKKTTPTLPGNWTYSPVNTQRAGVAATSMTQGQYRFKAPSSDSDTLPLGFMYLTLPRTKKPRQFPGGAMHSFDAVQLFADRVR